MPELPEVETIRRDLAARLTGLKILEVTRSASKMLRKLPAAALRSACEGRIFERAARHGKLLQLPLSGGAVLEIHLGMSGQLLLEPWEAPDEPHTHVEFRLERGLALRFRDPRRFGRWALVENGKRKGQVFEHAGVDPLDPAFDEACFFAIMRGARGELKRVLLDQSRIAGLGNIYVCEALHIAELSPYRGASSLSGSEAGRLFEAVNSVLTLALSHRGTTLLNYRDASGEQGGFQLKLAVYGREGESCPRCGSKVKRQVQAGRSTFYCPKCQGRGRKM